MIRKFCLFLFSFIFYRLNSSGTSHTFNHKGWWYGFSHSGNEVNLKKIKEGIATMVASPWFPEAVVKW